MELGKPAQLWRLWVKILRRKIAYRGGRLPEVDPRLTKIPLTYYPQIKIDRYRHSPFEFFSNKE
jgi:hypothetical protein